MIMIYPIERLVIISGSMFGSVYLFSTSLNNLNQIYLKDDSYKELNDDGLKKVRIINGFAMLFSGITFGYFAYMANMATK